MRASMAFVLGLIRTTSLFLGTETQTEPNPIPNQSGSPPMWILAVMGKVEASSFGNSGVLGESAVFPVCRLTARESANIAQTTALQSELLSIGYLNHIQAPFNHSQEFLPRS